MSLATAMYHSGRNPLKRFDDALVGLTPSQVGKFYADNFIDLMGAGLAPELRVRAAA